MQLLITAKQTKAPSDIIATGDFSRQHPVLIFLLSIYYSPYFRSHAAEVCKKSREDKQKLKFMCLAVWTRAVNALLPSVL